MSLISTHKKTFEASPLATRETAQAAALSASDWGRLYEVANQALMIDRRAWGDELLQSAGAAQTWSSFCFVMSAAPYLECRFLPSRDRHGARANIIEGSIVEALSFELARRVACALMGPLPPHEKNAREGHGEAEFFPLDDRLDEAYEILEEIHQRILDVPRSAACFAAPNAPIVGHYNMGDLLVGTHSRNPKYWVAETLLSSVAQCSWADLASYCAPISSRLPSSVFEEARVLGGFSVVGAGPSGGLGKAKEQARELIDCSVALGEAIEAPSTQVVGLGGLAVYLNGVSEGDPEALFYKKNFAIHVPSDMFGFAHEWIHALDYLTTTQGASPAKLALQNTHSSIFEQKPDRREVVAYTKMRRRGLPARRQRALQPNIDAIFASHGLPSVRELKSTTAQAARLSIIHELVAVVGDESQGRCVKKVAKILFPWLDSSQDPVDPSLIHALAWEACAHAREEAILAHHLAEGKNLFYACAMAEDGHSTTWTKRAKPYWSAPNELLARVGESYFLKAASQSAPAGLVSEPRQRRDDLKLSPEGFELLALSESLAAWIHESLPWLKSIALPGASNNRLAEQPLGRQPSPKPPRAIRPALG